MPGHEVSYWAMGYHNRPWGIIPVHRISYRPMAYHTSPNADDPIHLWSCIFCIERLRLIITTYFLQYLSQITFQEIIGTYKHKRT